MEVLTRDGEAFPVKRRLLRPCIALTQAVRSVAPSVAVDVDTLVFDRSATLLFTRFKHVCPSRSV